jgi:hypothetical protein
VSVPEALEGTTAEFGRSLSIAWCLQLELPLEVWQRTCFLRKVLTDRAARVRAGEVKYCIAKLFSNGVKVRARLRINPSAGFAGPGMERAAQRARERGEVQMGGTAGGRLCCGDLGGWVGSSALTLTSFPPFSSPAPTTSKHYAAYSGGGGGRDVSWMAIKGILVAAHGAK